MQTKIIPIHYLHKILIQNSRVRLIGIMTKTKDRKKRSTTYQNFYVKMKKTNIQERSTILNSVASSSEDVDLPHKRYCSK